MTKKIDDARAEEKAKYEQINAEHEKAIQEISARYAKAYKDLQTLKKTREQEILKDRNPAVLAQKLSEATGLKVQP